MRDGKLSAVGTAVAKNRTEITTSSRRQSPTWTRMGSFVWSQKARRSESPLSLSAFFRRFHQSTKVERGALTQSCEPLMCMPVRPYMASILNTCVTSFRLVHSWWSLPYYRNAFAVFTCSTGHSGLLLVLLLVTQYLIPFHRTSI